MKAFNYFREKNSIRDVRQDSKYTSDIQTFERKTQQKSVSCKNKLLTRESFSLRNIYKSLLKVKFFVLSIFLDLSTNVLQCHQYCNVQTLSMQLSLLQNEGCPLIKEGVNKRMGIYGQTPAKTLIIQFHLHLSTNKLWLADFKIWYIWWNPFRRNRP